MFRNWNWQWKWSEKENELKTYDTWWCAHLYFLFYQLVISTQGRIWSSVALSYKPLVLFLILFLLLYRGSAIHIAYIGLQWTFSSTVQSLGLQPILASKLICPALSWPFYGYLAFTSVYLYIFFYLDDATIHPALLPSIMANFISQRRNWRWRWYIPAIYHHS